MIVIEKHIVRTIRQWGPGTGTSACLGNQIPTVENITARGLFLDLGYDEFFDIDYNGNATFSADLNFPLSFKSPKADLLFDGGTMEHVANVGQCLQTIISLLAVGGVLVQTVPVANSYGDAYYAIDPQLLSDFYEANGFETLHQTLYCQRSIRRFLVDFADEHLPFAARLRDFLRDKKTVKDFVFRDSERHFRFFPVDKKYRRLPTRTCVLYVGRKMTEVNSIIWPTQKLYPSVFRRAIAA